VKILDRYLIKQFVQTILFGILAFTLIFVVIDMMENLDDFIDQEVEFFVIFMYYIYFIPEIVKLMTPVSVLFAGLFTTGRMANLNEITAIKSSGISMYRFMYPIIIVTIFISALSIYFGGFIVPKANKYKVEIEVNYLKKGISFAGSNIFFQDSRSRIVNISFFDQSNLTAVRVSVQEFNPDDLTKMHRRLDAQRLTYDTLINKWIAIEGIDREFNNISEKIEYFGRKELPNLNFLPSDLQFKQQKPEQMNLTELKKLIDDKIKSGNDPTSILIDYYSRFSFGMASFVSILFALPLSANKRKSGLALQFGINILITFIYLGLMKIFEAFGKNGAMNPLLTAWIVNILFTAGAIVNIFRIKQ